MIKKIIIFLSFFFFLGACDKLSNEKRPQNFDEKMIEFRTNTHLLRNSIKENQERITQLEKKVDAIEIDSIFSEWAEFNPDTKSFDAAKTSLGIFFVLIKKIEKYENGYKVTFSIGNPNSMVVNKTKIKVIYGPEFFENTKTYETDITEKLLPARWTDITVVLSPANKTDLNHISIRLDPQNISLYNDSNSRDKVE